MKRVWAIVASLFLCSVFGCAHAVEQIKASGPYTQSVAGAEIRELTLERWSATKTPPPVACAVPVGFDEWDSLLFSFTVTAELPQVGPVTMRSANVDRTAAVPMPDPWEYELRANRGTVGFTQRNGALLAFVTEPKGSLRTEALVVTLTSKVDPRKQVERHFRPDYHCNSDIGLWPEVLGSDGFTVTAQVTMVETSQYDRLVAVKMTGGGQKLAALFHPDQTVHVVAPGAAGADGNGGRGGMLLLVLDKRFPELANIVTGEAPGGKGGPGQQAGRSGTVQQISGNIAQDEFLALGGLTVLAPSTAVAAAPVSKPAAKSKGPRKHKALAAGRTREARRASLDPAEPVPN